MMPCEAFQRLKRRLRHITDIYRFHTSSIILAVTQFKPGLRQVREWARRRAIRAFPGIPEPPIGGFPAGGAGNGRAVDFVVMSRDCAISIGRVPECFQ